MQVQWIHASEVPASWADRPIWKFHPTWAVPECAPCFLPELSRDEQMFVALAEVPERPGFERNPSRVDVSDLPRLERQARAKLPPDISGDPDEFFDWVETLPEDEALAVTVGLMCEELSMEMEGKL